jgi:hypothetical protein
MAKLSKFHKLNPPKGPEIKPTYYYADGATTSSTKTTGTFEYYLDADGTPSLYSNEKPNEAGFIESRIPTFMEMVRRDRQTNPAAIFGKHKF